MWRDALTGLDRWFSRVMPDPFAVALWLTLLGFVGAAAMGSLHGPLELPALLDAWVHGASPRPEASPVGGLWSLLGFGMQMVLVLVTGFALADSEVVRRWIDTVASRLRTGIGAVMLVAVCSLSLGVLHWGLGLVVGALLARRVGTALVRRRVPVHYPVLVAAGYLGMAVWHGGLSGSAPLKATTEAGLAEVVGVELAARWGGIGLDQTVLSPRNVMVTVLAGALMVLTLLMLYPRKVEHVRLPPRELLDDEPPRRPASLPDWSASPADALSTGPWLSVGVAALGLAWLVGWVADAGVMRMTPNELNLACLALGLLAAGSPRAYAQSAQRAMSAATGIVLQFPLYGGLLGLLAVTGLVDRWAAGAPADVSALSLQTWWTAGLLNLVVPSGGGQWAIQGPVALQAAASHGVDPARVVLALAWGDQWTNLLQPFWALPLLGITKIRPSDLFAVTVLLLVPSGLVFALGAWW